MTFMMFLSQSFTLSIHLVIFAIYRFTLCASVGIYLSVEYKL